MFALIFYRLLHEDEIRREELGEDGEMINFMPKYKTHEMIPWFTLLVHKSLLRPKQEQGLPMLFFHGLYKCVLLTILYVAVTVEGLKAKLQKKEREAENKKQELVSNWNYTDPLTLKKNLQFIRLK